MNFKSFKPSMAAFKRRERPDSGVLDKLVFGVGVGHDCYFTLGVCGAFRPESHF